MITVRTAPYGYAGAGRLDVTRVGVDRASKANQPAPGLAFAPSGGILWPAKAHLDLVLALERRAAALPGGKAAAFVAVEAAGLLAKVEAAYERLYLAEMRVSAGLRRGGPRWGEDEEAAWRRGARPAPRAWQALLSGTMAGPEPVVVCFCPERQPGAAQRHTCHRHHLVRALVACGAADGGEVAPAKPPGPSKPRALPPLESLHAVSGSRPPRRDAGREAWELHRRILADVDGWAAARAPGAVGIHGGAEGVDSAAGAALRKLGHGEVVYRAWWDAWGTAAPLVRNLYVASADRLTAFPGPESRGTLHAIELAQRAGVDVDMRRLW